MPLPSVSSAACNNPRITIYYLIMAALLTLTLLTELMALGTFGIQFSRTRSFWEKSVKKEAKVCVLYGSPSNGINPTLNNNASCGFALWGIASTIIVLLVWIIYNIIMAAIGCPKVTSLLRILDLVVAGAMAFLSLIVSTVLTYGLNKTCGSFYGGLYNIPCQRRRFEGVGNSNSLAFYGNLRIAKYASWAGMIVFMLLACWNMILLFLHCCFSQESEESTKLITEKTEVEKVEEETELEILEKEKTNLDEDFPDDS